MNSTNKGFDRFLKQNWFQVVNFKLWSYLSLEELEIG